MKKRQPYNKKKLKNYRKNNPNVLRETRTDKKERLEREEQRRLDNATVNRNNTFRWRNGNLINDLIDDISFEVVNDDES